MTASSFNRIAIIVAMESEFSLVEHLLSDVIPATGLGASVEGRIGNKHVLLVHCGIGKVNAAVQTTELLTAFAPDCVLNTGVAGGIDTLLRVGSLVVGTQCVYHDMWCGQGLWGQVQGLPPRFNCDSRLLQKIENLDCDDIHFGLICTGDQFISDSNTLQSIKQHFPEALAVDMESCAIAQVCYLKNNTPFVSLRVISDTPGMVSDNTTQYQDFWTQAPYRTFDVIKRCIEQL
jgi:adenosylhomocysteine nucleosidase